MEKAREWMGSITFADAELGIRHCPSCDSSCRWGAPIASNAPGLCYRRIGRTPRHRRTMAPQVKRLPSKRSHHRAVYPSGGQLRCRGIPLRRPGQPRRPVTEARSSPQRLFNTSRSRSHRGISSRQVPGTHEAPRLERHGEARAATTGQTGSALPSTPARAENAWRKTSTVTQSHTQASRRPRARCATITCLQPRPRGP